MIATSNTHASCNAVPAQAFLIAASVAASANVGVLEVICGGIKNPSEVSPAP